MSTLTLKENSNQGNQMHDKFKERRQELRQHNCERLFVQVVASDDKELLGVTTSCNATDVSANGLSFETCSNIPDGCRLDIWVDNASRPGRFFLSSDVKWSEDSGNGFYHLGVELREGSTTDIEEWRRAYAT